MLPWLATDRVIDYGGLSSMEDAVATQISVEHFDVEPPSDRRFVAQINITGWSNTAPDAIPNDDRPKVIEIVFDRHDVEQLIAKLQSTLDE